MEGPREAAGDIWFTVPQAAAFLGRGRKAIYRWKARGLLTSCTVDEHGHQVYSQRELAAVEKKVRARAQSKLAQAA